MFPLQLLLTGLIIINIEARKECDLAGIFPVAARDDNEQVYNQWLKYYNDTVSLAMSIFNENSSDCKLEKFHIIDSGVDPGTSLNNLLDLSKVDKGKLCGIVGSFFSTEVESSAIFSTLNNDSLPVPYVSPSSTINLDRNIYPYYVSLGYSLDLGVIALRQYLLDRRRYFVGVLYNTGETYGRAFLQEFRKQNEGSDLYIAGAGFDEEYLRTSIRLRLQALKDTGYRTLLLVTETDAFLSIVAEEAADLDLVNGYLWIMAFENPIFDGRPEGQEYMSMEVMSFLDGNALFSVMMKYKDDPNVLSNKLPNEGSLRSLYDSVLSLSLAACSSNSEGSSFEALLNLSFNGMSGPVSFNIKTRTREYPVEYTITNLLPFTVDNASGYGDLGVVADVYSNNTWNSINNYIYNGGRVNAPRLYTNIADYKFPSSRVRWVGIVLMCLIISGSFLSVIWVRLNRDTPVIKLSSEKGLYLLCIATSLLSASGIATTFESRWLVQRRHLYDGYCRFFVVSQYLGFSMTVISYLLILMPLVSLNRNHGLVVNEKRIVRMVVTVIIIGFLSLLSSMFFDPWVLQDVVLTRNEFGIPTYSIYECDCSKRGNVFFFLLPIGLVVLTSTVAVAYLSLKLKPYDEPYKDGTWMFRCVISQMNVWVIGVPYLFLIGNISGEVRVLNVLLLLFIWCTSALSFIIIPKVIYARKERGLVRQLNLFFSNNAARGLASISESVASQSLSRISASLNVFRRYINNMRDRSVNTAAIASSLVLENEMKSTTSSVHSIPRFIDPAVNRKKKQDQIMRDHLEEMIANGSLSIKSASTMDIEMNIQSENRVESELSVALRELENIDRASAGGSFL